MHPLNAWTGDRVSAGFHGFSWVWMGRGVGAGSVVVREGMGWGAGEGLIGDGVVVGGRPSDCEAQGTTVKGRYMRATSRLRSTW